MDAIVENARGLSILVHVNWDRLLYLAGVAAALASGAWVGTLALG